MSSFVIYKRVKLISVESLIPGADITHYHMSFDNKYEMKSLIPNPIEESYFDDDRFPPDDQFSESQRRALPELFLRYKAKFKSGNLAYNLSTEIKEWTENAVLTLAYSFNKYQEYIYHKYIIWPLFSASSSAILASKIFRTHYLNEEHQLPLLNLAQPRLYSKRAILYSLYLEQIVFKNEYICKLSTDISGSEHAIRYHSTKFDAVYTGYLDGAFYRNDDFLSDAIHLKIIRVCMFFGCFWHSVPPSGPIDDDERICTCPVGMKRAKSKHIMDDEAERKLPP